MQISNQRDWMNAVNPYFFSANDAENLRSQEWLIDDIMISEIWDGMSTTDIHLLKFTIKSNL